MLDWPPAVMLASCESLGCRTVVNDEDEAPGWDAIDTAVHSVVADRDPFHVGFGNLPGQGLFGLSAFRADGHWLLVTYGMTDLFLKDSDDQQVSGWGYELTMRVPRDAEQPPAWTIRLLERLCDYTWSHGKPFASGHRMEPGGPITGRDDTRLRALAVTRDPELPAIDSPFGTVQFLTVVGITTEELARMKATRTATVLAELATRSRLLITDPSR
ncbi:suppressor of fused domain protein [Krasilnikovia sp. MM14-A1259]|uniref:suppressor of fused domain protein n=1 Tax=Krasilnikovia sp. MM14-A1259 TaxID=3373539 RepID=UPI0038093FDE